MTATRWLPHIRDRNSNVDHIESMIVRIRQAAEELLMACVDPYSIRDALQLAKRGHSSPRRW